MSTLTSQFPKIDLHCHLDGSISPKVLKILAKNANIEIPKSQEAFLKLMTAPKDCQSLMEYLKCFDLACACLQNKENLFIAAKSIVEDAAKEGIVYLELRFAPLLHINQGLKVDEILNAVILGCRAAEAELEQKDLFIRTNVIVCGMRHMPQEMNVQMLKQLSDFKGQGLCGVDIAGNEVDFPPITQKLFFELANQMEIPITIHAGECGSVENIYQAIELGAKRIGHGIALEKDVKARTLCREKRIGIEMCPTSNMQTKAVHGMENNPLKTFLKEDLKVIVNTDNRTVSQTTMNDEFELLLQYEQIKFEDLKTIYINSVEASFASDEIKHRLIKIYE